MNEKLKQAIEVFSDNLQGLSKKDLSNFLEDIMTPKEITEVKERIEIIKLLKTGLPQRIIADKLGVSITTVNR